MREICDIKTKKGDRVGNRLVRTITPLGADKLYDKFIAGAKGERLRTGEKMTILCRKPGAWYIASSPMSFLRTFQILGPASL